MIARVVAISTCLAIAGVCQLEAAGPRQSPAAWPGEEWTTATPSQVGMDAAPLELLHAEIVAGRHGNVDQIVVVRNGYLVADRRYPRDYVELSHGRTSPIGCGADACTDAADVHQYNYLHPDFHPFAGTARVHTLQSITKSVMSALVGIAIGRGEVPGVDAPLLSLLDGFDTSMAPAALREATLEDLLTMRLGIEWHENDRPVGPTNTTFAMENEADWVRFTLSQPMDAAPGEKWNYNSGASHLLSAIIRARAGVLASHYAERHLFGPLGIENYHWKLTPAGLPDGEGGLYLDGTDLARIGLLYLRDGMWNGARILPEGWVERSVRIHAPQVNSSGFSYGYQWWRIDRGETVIWAGLGFGGQFLVVLPQHDVVAVATSWNMFGGSQTAVLGPLVTAILASLGAG